MRREMENERWRMRDQERDIWKKNGGVRDIWKRELEKEREWAGEVGGDWTRRKVALKELLCIWGAVN